MTTVASFDIEVEEEISLDILLDKHNELILFNDPYNTFDFVIESLINVCNHDSIQAEQCTFIVHYNGKCSVKRGSMEKLTPMCVALLDRGLTAEIH